MRGRICLSASPAVSVEVASHPAGWRVYKLGPQRADPSITPAFHGVPKRERWCCPGPQLAGRVGLGPGPGS